MDNSIENREWSSLTYDEKNRLLYIKQKELLGMFLERNAITKAQYEKSLHDLALGMGNAVEKSQE